MSFDTPTPSYNASDPHATFLNISCLDLLLIETVPLAERMARRAERMERGEVDGDEDDEGDGGGRRAGTVLKKSGGGKHVGAKGEGGVDVGGDGDVYRDAIFFRLDGWGYRVGQGLSERYLRASFFWVVHGLSATEGFLSHRSRGA